MRFSKNETKDQVYLDGDCLEAGGHLHVSYDDEYYEDFGTCLTDGLYHPNTQRVVTFMPGF